MPALECFRAGTDVVDLVTMIGDSSVALRVPTTPVRARIVEAWTYLYAAQVAVLALVGTVLVRPGRLAAGRARRRGDAAARGAGRG